MARMEPIAIINIVQPMFRVVMEIPMAIIHPHPHPHLHLLNHRHHHHLLLHLLRHQMVVHR